MKFLFDANIPKKAQAAVRSMFASHLFVAAWDKPFAPDLDDLSLFRLAKQEGIDAIITHDVAQMIGVDRRDERRRCAECGLHWLGIPQPFRVPGPLRKSAHTSSGLLHALVDVIALFDAAVKPTAVLLNEVPDQVAYQSGYPQSI
ncbi:hypothetical protein [Corynebacterium lizhenjunii]|uniref:hypothetical protein n=1 Tax=Corynebacterium lizhenjunii TaxID=2709394 RepID=UPI0013EE063D|nr:hypothetical protein [Corynebacterium lizhenjunii]